ncbi:MAG TPA: hypothetical protein VN791_02380 [Acidimicrobiales bacterium]|nr:hypothetical protein [Acidimicrobiales bacterium]
MSFRDATGGTGQMGRGRGQTTTQEREASVEDLGEDVVALAVAAEARGRASALRRVNGILVRVIVEVA